MLYLVYLVYLHRDISILYTYAGYVYIHSGCTDSYLSTVSGYSTPGYPSGPNNQEINRPITSLRSSSIHGSSTIIVILLGSAISHPAQTERDLQPDGHPSSAGSELLALFWLYPGSVLAQGLTLFLAVVGSCVVPALFLHLLVRFLRCDRVLTLIDPRLKVFPA